MERNLNNEQRGDQHIDRHLEMSNYDVLAAKAQALAAAARNWDAASTTLALRDLDALMPYFRQEVLSADFDESSAEALRRE